MNQQPQPIPDLTDEQALALNRYRYGELPHEIQSQVTAHLTAMQMAQQRRMEELK